MTQHTLKSNFETVLLPPKGQFFDRSRAKDAPRAVEPEPALLSITGVHPAGIKIAMSAVVWFLAVVWFDFSGGPEVDLNLAIVTGFFVMFLTLSLLASFYGVPAGPGLLECLPRPALRTRGST